MSTGLTGAIDPILVVGAGLSGLMAARTLNDLGYRVIVIEANDAIGGRLLTLELGDGRFDSGAQFFTVRERRFERLVRDWAAAGVVTVWSNGFAGAGGQPRHDGHPRYRGVPGMDGIAHHLAQGLDVRLGRTVSAATYRDVRWQLGLADGETLQGGSLVLTPPLPLSLALLEAGGIDLPAPLRAELAAIEYAPCLALLVELDGESNLPAPGGVQLHGEPITFIGDNRRKGVSARTTAVTIHAGPQFSRDQWQTADEEAAAELMDAADFWLGAPVRQWRLIRWRYSVPTEIVPRRAVAVAGAPGLVLAGDVFGGPRVEGAALSGLAAAELLLAGA